MSQPALTPELYVTDIDQSRRFYLETLGFRLVFDRPAENFCAIAIGDAHLMLEQLSDSPRCWRTGPMERPFGRGINFQIMVETLDPILANLDALDVVLAPESNWYETDVGFEGQQQLAIKDPDGYLLRFAQSLGTRPKVVD